MRRSPARLLDVGNCDPDHGMIRRMLERHFDVAIDRVMFVDEAIDAMRNAPYDLVLINRLIFADGSPGIELLRRVSSEPSLDPVPIMMISNFAEAHAECVAAGGLKGFGKAAINSPETIDGLAAILPRRVAAAS